MPNEAMPKRAHVRLGSVLKGKYRLDRVLGSGGMATVFAATHRNGKEFAVKVLHPELSVIDEIRARFVREGYAANRVKHPGAVAVLDDDVTDEGITFLVMELLHGETIERLRERLGPRLPLELVVGIGLQLLDVLGAAHGRGVIHRDVKPENLILSSEGHLKVLDFGIARLRDVAASHTTAGFTMGTPAYMAPEQALAELGDIDPRTDLWAAGATLFTLASGETVHGAESSQQVLIRAATAAARPLAKVLPKAPRAVCAVVDRALAFAKESRWPSAKEMGQALRDSAVAVFGRVPGPSELAAIAARQDQDAVGAPKSDRPSEEAASPSQPEPTGPRRGVVAGVTAEPVSADSVARGRNGNRRARRRLVAFGAAGSLVFVGVGIAVRASLGPSGPAPPSMGVRSTVPATSLMSSAAPMATLDSPPAPPQASTMLAPIAPEIEPASVAPAPIVLQPKAKPPAMALSSPQPPPSVVPKNPCRPPYELDVNGNKRWKRECL
jgi:serine/threonine protein kinase